MFQTRPYEQQENQFGREEGKGNLYFDFWISHACDTVVMIQLYSLRTVWCCVSFLEHSHRGYNLRAIICSLPIVNDKDDATTAHFGSELKQGYL